MELYIIRHGQSYNNAVEDGKERVCDPPLTDLGRQQAEFVARRLEDLDWARCGSWDGERGLRLTRLYASPMLRGFETAEAIRVTTGLTPDVWIDVHEHGGIWLDRGDERGPVGLPGMGRKEIEERFPNFVLPDGIRENGWWDGDCEGEDAWYVRSQRVADELQGLADSEERIGMVTHGGFGNSLMDVLFGLPRGGPYIRFTQNNTAISRVDFTPEKIEMRFLNRVDHLTEEMVT